MVGDHTHIELAPLPVTSVDDAIIADEGAFTVELVIRKCSLVLTSVREGKCALSVEQSVRELAFVHHLLARFFAESSW